MKTLTSPEWFLMRLKARFERRERNRFELRKFTITPWTLPFHITKLFSDELLVWEGSVWKQIGTQNNYKRDVIENMLSNGKYLLWIATTPVCTMCFSLQGMAIEVMQSGSKRFKVTDNCASLCTCLVFVSHGGRYH